MSFDRYESPRPEGARSIKIGLKKTRDEYAGLDRLDRPELDEDEGIPGAPESNRRVA